MRSEEALKIISEAIKAGTYTNLSGTDLSYANLSYTNLSYTNLSYTNLSYANLSGIIVNWQSHALISELLLREAGDDIRKMSLAGTVRVCTNKCWDFWGLYDHPEKLWALEVLRRLVKSGDNAPKILQAGEYEMWQLQNKKPKRISY